MGDAGPARAAARPGPGAPLRIDVERACFALALQRLCAPGSDLQGAAWVRTVESPGFEALELQHLYRTVGGLAQVRPELETDLFWRDRDLFSQSLDLVFIETTSTYIYRTEETPRRCRGYSRDRRPDLPQVILCVAVDRHGWPVAWDIMPGNTEDIPAFVAMLARLQQRFRLGRVIMVADRRLVIAKTLALLEGAADAPFEFVVGCKLRRQKEISEEVLARAGRDRVVADNLEVKEVVVDDRRDVVCRNPVKKDAAALGRIVAKLEAALAHGPKSVLGNRGFARFVRVQRGAVTLDRTAIERDARLDGKFGLRTNTARDAADVARAYKSLWRVERTFRETKSTLAVRPVFPHRDDTTIGHIVGCFLALRLEVDLQRRLDARGVDVAWPDLMLDLSELRAVELTLDGQRSRLRTESCGAPFAAFAAAGVRPPAAVTPLGAVASLTSVGEAAV